MDPPYKHVEIEPDAEDIAEVAIMFTEIRLCVRKVYDKSVEMDILKMR
jgi:hypothetical protein